MGRHCFGSLGQEPEQLGSLCTEPASDLNTNTNHHQPATARPAELGVGVAALAPGGSHDCKAGLHVGPWMGFAFRGIERELGAVPEREAVGDDLHAPFITDWRIEVHVSEAHVPRDRVGELGWQARRRYLLQGLLLCKKLLAVPNQDFLFNVRETP